MLDGADVTNVDDRESIVKLAAYWPLGFFALLREGGGRACYSLRYLENV